MVEDGGYREGGRLGCHQQEGAMGKYSRACKDLSEQQLESIYAEEDPQKQFELFASYLGFLVSTAMSTPDRIVAEYDYLNVMFCREQKFTAQQTIAFRGISRDVFEASVVRGELNLDEAFQVFTERVLSLAVEAENDEPAAVPVAGAGEERCRDGGDGVGGSGSGGGNDSIADPTARSVAGATKKDGKGAPASKKPVVDGSTGKDKVSGAPGSARSARGSAGHGGVDKEDASATPRAPPEDGTTTESRADGSSPKDALAKKGPVFSVGNVAAITQFVARGLYRNFALYRMCFEEEPRFCRESRHVQVETPLPPPPLHEAEPV